MTVTRPALRARFREIVERSPDQDAEALAYSLNILRTHYTPSQRAMFAARRATATKADGAMIRETRRVPPLNLEEVPVTVPQAAREAAVAESAVHLARRIVRDADPEVAAAVEAGRLTLHSAEQIMSLERLDREERERLVALRASPLPRRGPQPPPRTSRCRRTSPAA